MPETAPNLVIALEIQVDVIFSFKFENSDQIHKVPFQEIAIIFSNQTGYNLNFYREVGVESVDTLNMSLSIQIIDQCEINLLNNKFSFNYSYNIGEFNF